ncbi:DUF4097 family beta strand repeat-containing protein [Nonomuraea sp. MTCD27]|uniref:DUF4097 family beta strand repeat-containing protein n=1 Tax=Nonomuraea sp. MTCD27 TaxID=1676747 RepID=UPI0035BEE72D
MRGAWLTAGAVVTVAALVLSSVGLWRGFARARTPTDVTMRSIPFEYPEVRIKAGKGQVNLFILSGRAGELLIHRSLRWSRDRPTVTEDWDTRTRTLRLDAVCPGFDQPTGPICQADYMLYVPPETDLEAGTSGGDLMVDDLFGDVRLTSVSGDIRVRSVSGDLWARTGTGLVDAKELSGGGKADVEVGSGDVDLSFSDVPTEVKAVVRTSGDVSVNVPRDVYDVTTVAANTTINVERKPGTARKITARAPGGAVSVIAVCCE